MGSVSGAHRPPYAGSVFLNLSSKLFIGKDHIGGAANMVPSRTIFVTSGIWSLARKNPVMQNAEKGVQKWKLF
jgi:hypothetical protein